MRRSARTVLCGGYRVIGIPTATARCFRLRTFSALSVNHGSDICWQERAGWRQKAALFKDGMPRRRYPDRLVVTLLRCLSQSLRGPVFVRLTVRPYGADHAAHGGQQRVGKYVTSENDVLRAGTMDCADCGRLDRRYQELEHCYGKSVDHLSLCVDTGSARYLALKRDVDHARVAVVKTQL